MHPALNSHTETNFNTLASSHLKQHLRQYNIIPIVAETTNCFADMNGGGGGGFVPGPMPGGIGVTLGGGGLVPGGPGPPDICTDNPCKNGGECEVAPRLFVCNCQPGYFGHLCESSKYWYLRFVAIFEMLFNTLSY